MAWVAFVYVSVQFPVCRRLCGCYCRYYCTCYTIHLFSLDYIYVSTMYRRAVCGSAVVGFVFCVFSVCFVVRSGLF